MKVAKVRISNILGIDTLEILPGQFTVITGQNSSGKTSVLSAIRSVFDGGNDATLLRKGAEHGEVVIVLDDGTEIREDIDAEDKAKYSIREPVYGSKMSEPRKVIARLFDPNQLNPVAFLAAKGKDRLNMLLEAIPMKVSPEEIKDAVGDVVTTPAPAGHALQAIDGIRKWIFDTRTGCNRALKEKGATAEELQQTVPTAAEMAHNWEEAAARAESDDKATRDARAKELAGVVADAGKKTAEAEKDASDILASLTSQESEEINEIRVKFANKRNEIQKARDLAKDGIRAQREAKNIAIEKTYAEQLEKLSAEAATAREKATALTRNKAQLDLLGKMKLDVLRLDDEAAKLTGAIERLDALKVKLCSKLPVKGLEVREGEIYLDGVAFERVNTANQIHFAIELAKLRAGKLKLVVVDGLERMDSSFFAEFEQAAKATDLQWIVTRVTDAKELGIRTVGEVPSVAPPATSAATKPARKEAATAATADSKPCPF
jgi:energy-coupling factor transporter ATP-binding protein EcfA2